MSLSLNDLVNEIAQEEQDKLKVFGDARVEEGVLGACLTRTEQLSLARTLIEPGDFSVAQNVAAFSAMCELYDSGLSIDPVTVASVLRSRGKNGANQQAFVEKLASLGIDEIDLGSYCAIMREASRKRKCFTLGLALQRMARSTVPSDDIAGKAEQTLREITYGYGASQQVAFKAGEIRDALPGKDADILLPYGGQTPIPFPIKSVMAVFDGFFRKTMTVLGARPSVGKTALACQCAVAAGKAGFPTAFFSLEMSKEAILRRMVCTEAGIPRSLVRDLKRDGIPDELRDKCRDATDMVNALPVWIADKVSRNIESMRREMERMRALYNIRFFVVDHMQLMKTSAKGGYSNRTQELGDISGSLKTATMDLDMALLVLSQITRDVVKRADKSNAASTRPTIADLYMSGAIEADADSVALLHRPGLYSDRFTKNTAELIIGKQREGAVDTVNLEFDLDMCAFSERDESYKAIPFNAGNSED
jgi:replicative DNA helicase